MIKRQRRQLVQPVPADFRSVVGSLRLELGSTHPPQENNADRPAAWIAPRVAERVQLFELAYFQAGFLLQFPPGTRLQGFVHVHETAWDGPFPGERIVLALD